MPVAPVVLSLNRGISGKSRFGTASNMGAVIPQLVVPRVGSVGFGSMGTTHGGTVSKVGAITPVSS